MESKTNKYDLYKNDSSNDEFIKFMDKKKNRVVNYEKFYETTLEQKRMFQGIINEYFFKEAKDPLKNLVTDIYSKKIVFGDNDESSVIKFLTYLSSYQWKSEDLFVKGEDEKEDDDDEVIEDKRAQKKYYEKGKLLPERNRIFFDKEKNELGFDADTVIKLYQILEIGKHKYTDDEMIKIKGPIFEKFYDWHRQIEPNLYSFVIKGLENHDLNKEFLSAIDIVIYDYKFEKKNEVADVLKHLKKDQKIDCEFVSLFKKNFDFEVDKTKEMKIELMSHFDNEMSLSDMPFFANKEFFDPEIIPKDQIKKIINTAKSKENLHDGKIKISLGSFVKVHSCLCKYNDKQLTDDFVTLCKDKIDLSLDFYFEISKCFKYLDDFGIDQCQLSRSYWKSKKIELENLSKTLKEKKELDYDFIQNVADKLIDVVKTLPLTEPEKISSVKI